MYDVLSMKSASKTLNDLTYSHYYYTLMLIAKSIYKWENLPNGMNEKWIEKYLFSAGKCVFFEDFYKGFMVTDYTEHGTLNYYDEPTKVKPIATSYNGKVLERNKNCVIIGNNDILLPTSFSLQMFAYRLAQCARISDVNINAQKTPVAVLCDEKQKLSFKRAMKNVEDNELLIFGDKSFELGGIKALKVDAPVVFDKLTLQKHEIWNEAMTFLGLNNANQDKRERLVADEVQANNEQVEACANVFLKARQQACKEINELFGLEIKVSMREVPRPKLSDIERGLDDDNELFGDDD